ncbi:MAG: N-acetylmuramoyl-L-alanine amidase-like domain-containing protein [Nitrospirota bacterium]
MLTERILLGKFSEDQLDSILSRSSRTGDVGERIAYLSEQFLGVGYGESTLIGSRDMPEVFVISLSMVDCFTLLEYVEALRRAESFSQFRENLRKVRYKSGEVVFTSRNHFFTDWPVHNGDSVTDVTREIGDFRDVAVQKRLNEKGDGTRYLNGIEPFSRRIRYIPSEAIDETIISRMETGDYIGIYSHSPGLDVSHTGILVKKDDGVFLRHASSQEQHRKVVDQEFSIYIADRPGIVVLRPK